MDGPYVILPFLAALAVLLLLIAFAREQGARDAKAWEAWKAGPGRVESKPQREAGPDLFLMLRDCASEGSLTEWVRHLPWEQHSPEWGVAALVDCETTGLYHQDELIELAVILFYFDRTTAAVHGIADWYVGWREPAVEINPDATKKNGITRDMVAGKMLDSRRVDAIFDRAEFFIAHNAGFDSRFVSCSRESKGNAGFARCMMSTGNVVACSAGLLNTCWSRTVSGGPKLIARWRTLPPRSPYCSRADAMAGPHGGVAFQDGHL
jgi:hypothetical protein